MTGLLDFLKEHLGLIVSFFGIGTLAGVIVWLKRFRENLTSFNAEPFLPSIPLKILVSPLLHDPERRQTDHIVDALRNYLEAGEQSGHCDYRVLPKSVQRSASETGSAQRQRVADRIQKLIAMCKADLMIWGHVVKEDQSLHLAISARQGEAHQGNRRYRIDQSTLSLPEDFAGDLGGAIAAFVVSEIGTITGRRDDISISRAKAIAAATAQLIEAPPPGMSPMQRGDLREASARAHGFLSQQTGDLDALQTAIRAYKMAAKDYHAGNLKDRWAITQNSLGNVLCMQGQQEGDAAILANAAKAYRKALSVQGKTDVPFNWSSTRHNLADAVRVRGELEGSADLLIEAVAEYHLALKEGSRERAPLDWAATQSGLGDAQRALGERMSDAKALKKAAKAYRRALKEQSRESTPRDWAATQVKRGDALCMLGTFQGDRKPFSKARRAFRRALKVLTRADAPEDWAKTQVKLASVHIALFGASADTTDLEAAETHAQAALEVFREAAASHYIGVAEDQLAQIARLRSGN